VHTSTKKKILFGYILQYLRTGIRPVDSTSELLQRDILIEAQFY